MDLIAVKIPRGVVARPWLQVACSCFSVMHGEIGFFQVSAVRAGGTADDTTPLRTPTLKRSPCRPFLHRAIGMGGGSTFSMSERGLE